MNPFLSILLWSTYLLSLYFSVFWLLIFIEHAPGFFEKPKRKACKYPLVTIIVPAKNEEQTITATLQSVIELDYPTDKLEIIAVCNATTDRSMDRARTFISMNPKHNIRLIYSPKPGKGRALNQALSISHGEFFACLDADSAVDSGSLQKMLAVFEEQDNKLTIVTPAMKIRSPSNIYQRLQRIEYLLSIFIGRLMSKLDCLYVAPGPFSLYRTRTIIKLGGFDENNITEDMEIAYRCQREHLKITQCPDAWVTTVGPTTAKTLYAQRNRWFKGGLLNAIKYKDLLANPRYGDFGFLQMSINFMLFFFSATAILFFSYYMIWPFFTGFWRLYLIGFDVWPLLTHLSLNFSPLYIDIEKVFIANFMMALTLGFIWIAHKNANESLRQTRWTILPYIFVYYLALSLVALAVFAETAIGKKPQWEEKKNS